MAWRWPVPPQVPRIHEREGGRVLGGVPQVLLLTRLAVDLEALHEPPPEGQREHERVEAALVARGVVAAPQLGGAHLVGVGVRVRVRVRVMVWVRVRVRVRVRIRVRLG